MTPIHTPDPRTLARPAQRPWRSVEHEPRRPGVTPVRTFSAPVVRELPPRRDQCGGGAW
jgi:hypothetical protein